MRWSEWGRRCVICMNMCVHHTPSLTVLIIITPQTSHLSYHLCTDTYTWRIFQRKQLRLVPSTCYVWFHLRLLINRRAPPEINLWVRQRPARASREGGRLVTTMPQNSGARQVHRMPRDWVRRRRGKTGWAGAFSSVICSIFRHKLISSLAAIAGKKIGELFWGHEQKDMQVCVKQNGLSLAQPLSYLSSACTTAGRMFVSWWLTTLWLMRVYVSLARAALPVRLTS